MNSKLIQILTVLALSVLISGIAIFMQAQPEENNTVAAVQRLENQLEHVHKIQKETNRVIMEDDETRELITGKNCLKLLEIIHNESYVEDFYRIGFYYENLEECEGYKMVGGKMYKFNIDLSNKTVLSVEEAENQTPNVKETKEEGFTEGTYTTIHSLISMRSSSGACIPATQRWLYVFSVEGDGKVRLKPDTPTRTHGWGCFKHRLTIEEIYNKEKFWFNEHENDPESKKAWCSGDKLPHIESRSEDELITCEVTYPREKSVFEFTKPRNWPSDAGFYYRWNVWVKPNQTIMFDMTVKLDSIENARNKYEKTHDWRVILTAPPSPSEISGAEMKKYGIEAIPVPGTKMHEEKVGPNKYEIEIFPDYVNKTCNYYAHNPIIIVKKEAAGNAIGDEDGNNS